MILFKAECHSFEGFLASFSPAQAPPFLICLLLINFCMLFWGAGACDFFVLYEYVSGLHVVCGCLFMPVCFYCVHAFCCFFLVCLGV